MDTITASGNMQVSNATLSGKTQVLEKIYELIDESNEQFKGESLDKMKSFLESTIEDLIGQEVTTIPEYLSQNLPEHLYDYLSFITDVVIRVLS
ncbi:hypothetical protein WN740_001008 [Vibrio parahaemolyticus]